MTVPSSGFDSPDQMISMFGLHQIDIVEEDAAAGWIVEPCQQRSAFIGTLDRIMDDIHTAAEAGTDELIVDLNLQDWFTSTGQMLETAVQLRERAEAA